MLKKILNLKKLKLCVSMLCIITFEKTFCLGPVGGRVKSQNKTTHSPLHLKNQHAPTHTTSAHHQSPQHISHHHDTSKAHHKQHHIKSPLKKEAEKIKKEWEKRSEEIKNKLDKKKLSKEEEKFLSHYSKDALEILMTDMVLQDSLNIKITETKLVSNKIEENKSLYEKHIEKNDKHFIKFNQIQEKNILYDKLIEYLVIAFVKDEFTEFERAGFFKRLFGDLPAGQIIFEFVIQKKDLILLAYRNTEMFKNPPSNEDIVDLIIDKLIIYLNRNKNTIFSKERMKKEYIPACSIEIDKKSKNYKQLLIVQQAKEKVLKEIIKIQTGSAKSFGKAVAPVSFIKKAAKWGTGVAAVSGALYAGKKIYDNPEQAKRLASQAKEHMKELGLSAQKKIKEAYTASKGKLGNAWQSTKNLARKYRK
jgi:hypothetical protein